MLEVVEGVSPGVAAAAVQPVADIAVADIVVAADIAADVAAQPVDNTAAGTADAVVLVDIVGSDIAAALVVGYGAPLAADLYLPPPLAASASAVGSVSPPRASGCPESSPSSAAASSPPPVSPPALSSSSPRSEPPRWQSQSGPRCCWSTPRCLACSQSGSPACFLPS